MTNNELKAFLDRKVEEYNTPSFIPSDPISLPHLFSEKGDIEIAGLFAALFAWGNRTIIINKGKELLQRMDNAPFHFCRHHQASDLKKLLGFKHRTFNDTDLLYFIHFLHHHYTRFETLEEAFFQNEFYVSSPTGGGQVGAALNGFYRYFFSLPDAPARTRKHIAAPCKGSTCKRINMFLRWMVRSDTKGVDFGIWKKLKPHQLICPVDVHVGRVARQLGLLERKQIDWAAAVELTANLKHFDAVDPVKYDFALFSLGVVEKF